MHEILGRNVELEGDSTRPFNKVNTNTALQLETCPRSDCECVFAPAALDVNSRHDYSVLIYNLSVGSVVSYSGRLAAAISSIPCGESAWLIREKRIQIVITLFIRTINHQD